MDKKQDEGLVYGHCDVCDRSDHLKEYHQRTGKVVRLCLRCLGPGYHQLIRKKGHGKVQRKEGDKRPFLYTQTH